MASKGRICSIHSRGFPRLFAWDGKPGPHPVRMMLLGCSRAEKRRGSHTRLSRGEKKHKSFSPRRGKGLVKRTLLCPPCKKIHRSTNTAIGTSTRNSTGEPPNARRFSETERQRGRVRSQASGVSWLGGRHFSHIDRSSINGFVSIWGTSSTGGFFAILPAKNTHAKRKFLERSGRL